MLVLYGGCARGNPPEGGTLGEADVLRFRISTGGNQNVDTQVHHRRFDGLMAEMADRAGVGGGTGVIVPDHSESSPQDQRDKRDRHYQAPESFLIGHCFEEHLKDPVHLLKSV
jgi:hypothetical protein